VRQRGETDEHRSPGPGREAAPPEPGSARWWIQRAATGVRRRPRAGGLSTTRIVETALEVLREHGLEALTLRAVANRLGIASNASLYRHIASRDELIVLIIDHIMGDVRLERTGRGWRADAEALMGEMRRVIIDQPLPISVARGRSADGPNMLRIVDAALRLFLDAGLTPDQATFATTTIIEFTAGATTIHRTKAGHRPAGPVGSAHAADFDQLLDGLPAGESTALRAAAPDYLAASAEDIFARGLSIILDGIASSLPQDDR
jgi:TetR/AcrR family tetracycline transcriptional repressor